VDTDNNKKDPRTTRIVCAKLYEGGLLSSYEILSSIKRRPFKGKSPEFELDIDLIIQHAEAAFAHHIEYTLLAIILSLMALISYIYNATLSFIFSICVICLLTLKHVWDRSIAFNHFSKGNFDKDYNIKKSPDEPNGIKDYLKPFCDFLIRNNIKHEKDEGKNQNIIIFGDYFPFLGAGKRTRNWNFVTDLSKPKKGIDSIYEPQSKDEKGNIISELSLKELYEAVYARIHSKNFPNLLYKFILFADGNKESEINFILKNREKPNTYLKNLDVFTDQSGDKSGTCALPKDIESFFEICEEGIFKDFRTYFNISHHDENRSTLFSTFLRFSKIEKELFAECSFFVLTPINENIYNIDKLPRNNILFILKSVLITVSLILVYNLFSWSIIPAFILFILSVLPIIIILRNRVKEQDYKIDVEQIKRGEPHNYGLLTTFRETIASPDYKNYFSAQDIVLIQNTIENAIIDSVADLLDKKGIDASFLRTEMISFINKGIMQFGGKMENAQVVSGEGNQAIQKIQQFTQRVTNASKEA
jgi:hypothetical protein